jgi:hypothetical protein
METYLLTAFVAVLFFDITALCCIYDYFDITALCCIYDYLKPLSAAQTVASNDWIISKQFIGQNVKYCRTIRLEGLRKHTTKLNSRCPYRQLNNSVKALPPEYDVEVPHTRPRYFVS